MTGRVLVALLVLVLVGGLVIGLLFVCQYRRYEKAYAGLERGASRSGVLESFGDPDEIQSCQGALSWDGEPLNVDAPECVEEFRYQSRISPEQWFVGFDASGRVVGKAHFVSP